MIYEAHGLPILSKNTIHIETQSRRHKPQNATYVTVICTFKGQYTDKGPIFFFLIK